MIKIHFYEKSTELQGKPINIEDFYSVMGDFFTISDPHLLTYEYLNADDIYNIIDKLNFNQFLDDNVTDIFIYCTQEESQTYKNNNNEEQIIEIKAEEEEEKEEENPNFYEENSDNENNINKQYEISLNEKIKQNIINSQLKKIRESRLKKEEEEKEKEKIQNQNIIININKKMDNNMEKNGILEDKIVNIINKNLEKFKEDLIHMLI